MPSPAIFFSVAKKAFSILVSQNKNEGGEGDETASEKDPDLFENLRDHLDIDAKFSEARCAKVLPLALATYQQNSPFHYTREYHESRVSLFFKNISV